jgi:hypothetical protein
MPRKPGSKPSDDGSQGQAKAGVAGPGVPFDPTGRRSDQACAETTTRKAGAAPAPGLPVSDQQYAWLKRKAKVVRRPPSSHAQEDPSGKKKP